MMDIEFIELNRKLLQYYLDEFRNLRRDIVVFLESLGDIWKKFPSDMTNENKISILMEIIKTFIEELDYSSGAIEQQYVSISNKEYQSYASTFNFIKDENIKLNSLIDNIIKENSENLYRIDTEYKYNNNQLIEEISKLKSIIKEYEGKLVEKDQELSKYQNESILEINKKDEILSQISYEMAILKKDKDQREQAILEAKNEILSLKQKNEMYQKDSHSIRSKLIASIDKHKKDFVKSVPIKELNQILG